MSDVLTLTPDASSVRTARHWLAGELAGMPHEVAANAQLLVSEVVTNALLHAGTTIRVRASRRGDVLRVETMDGSPKLPVVKRYSLDAATGRGIQLVEAIADRWGVITDEGSKTVWFELICSQIGAVRATMGTQGVVQVRTEMPDASDGATPLYTCVILRLPIPLQIRAAEQYDGLIRELQMIHESDPDEARETLPRALLALTEQLGTRFAGFTTDQEAAIQNAARHDAASIDLEYAVPGEMHAAYERLDALLDEADAYCTTGDFLLTLSPTPDAVALRKWYLGEFSRQGRGEAPTPWPESSWARQLIGAED